MSDCPDIDVLLQPGAPRSKAVAEHIARCRGCAAILALEAFRGLPDRSGPPAACDEALPEIAALADGVIDDLGRRRLAEHLAGCAGCRETLVTMMAVDGDRDDVPAPVVAPAAGGAEPTRVPERPPVSPLRERPPKRKVGWTPAVVIPLAAVVAVLAAAAAVVVATREPAPPGTSTAPEPVPATAPEVPRATVAEPSPGPDAGSRAVAIPHQSARPEPRRPPRAPADPEGPGR